MSAMLGTYLSSLSDLPFILLLFLICLFAQVFTEFASNVAVANGIYCFYSTDQLIANLFICFFFSFFNEIRSYVARPR